MPSRPPAQSLAQILDSIETIQTLTLGMDRQAYEENRVIRLAVERLLQIMTEAAHRLGRQAPAICPEVDWRDIREMGNALRHDYDELLNEVLWNTVTDVLPTLKTSMQAALDRIARRAGGPTL